MNRTDEIVNKIIECFEEYVNRKTSMFIAVLLIIAIAVYAQKNLAYTFKTEFGKEYRILKQTETYLVSEKTNILEIQYISAYFDNKEKMKEEAEELSKRIILLNPSIINKYGGIAIQAVEKEPKEAIYAYKSHLVFRYIGDLNKLVDFSILNIRFTNGLAGLQEIEPAFTKNEKFYIHYSIIGFVTDEDGNAQITKKIEIADPQEKRMQITKDLGKIYGENTKVITSYDELIFEEKDKEGKYKFKVTLKDKLSGKTCSKQVIYFKIK